MVTVRKRYYKQTYIYEVVDGKWIYLGKEKPIQEWLNKIHCGDAYKLLKLMPSESVDCVVTSPPYYGLRVYGGEEVKTIFGGNPNCEHEWGEYIPSNWKSWRWNTLKNPTHPNGVKQATHTISKDHGTFCIKCGAWKGQLGLEPDWRMYVEHLVELFREVKRVLKKTGSLWLNIGDTYASKPTGSLGRSGWERPHSRDQSIEARRIRGNVNYPSKCLMGIPWRVAFALIDDGWILRNAVIWHKPNATPSSAKDRLAQTYEYIFHFVKSRKYYYNLDNIMEPHRTIPTPNPLKNNDEKFNFNKLIEYCLKKYEEAVKERVAYDHKGWDEAPESFKAASEWNRGARETMNKIIDSLPVPEEVKAKLRSWWHDAQSHPLGSNPGDVISFTKHDLAVGRIGNYSYMDPLHVKAYNPLGRNPGDFFSIPTRPFKGAHFAVFPPELPLRPILASCPPDGIVLDPLAGSGTVAYTCELINHAMWDEFRLPVNNIARSVKWNIKWIMIDINPEYCKIMEERLEPFIKQKSLDEFKRT
jgi:DNA modification methylase